MDSKRNVQVFDADVKLGGGYAYTNEHKLSSRIANQHISVAMISSVDLRGKTVIDLGCGDGTYTLDLALAGAAHVTGLEPAAAATALAQTRAERAGLANCTFRTGSIYDLDRDSEDRFDVAVLRGVLHHLPDPGRAVAVALKVAPVLMIMEPNGWNPVLKLLERFSKYHIEHEEQSFLPGTVDRWCREGGATSIRGTLINLVPMFCPDWIARFGQIAGPLVEKVPIARAICCGQYIVVASRGIDPGATDRPARAQGKPS